VTYSLAGRSALITGASQGLGLAIARAYVAAGASVLVCARDGDLIDRVGQELASSAGPSQVVAAQQADVSSPDQVERMAARALGLFPHLDILVNNAGICGPLGEVEATDWREWVKTIEINLLGSVLAVRAVLPHMKSRRYGKIIQISGGGATTPLPWISAYAASKAAVVRFAESLALEVREHGIDVNAIAPGALNTRMMRAVLDAGPSAVGDAYFARMSRIASEGGTPLEMGAGLATFLAAAESDGITGRLISAPWDPWPDLPERRAALEGSDIYTLRRITPADRGHAWGEK
jgi:NAD(P)-dependent dehydrogenase (short-subunit alcohol dehydrogenase family)